MGALYPKQENRHSQYWVSILAISVGRQAFWAGSLSSHLQGWVIARPGSNRARLQATVVLLCFSGLVFEVIFLFSPPLLSLNLFYLFIYLFLRISTGILAFACWDFCQGLSARNTYIVSQPSKGFQAGEEGAE